MGSYVGMKPPAAGSPGPGGWDDQAFARACPALNEYLTLRSYVDGTSRQTATLLFVVDPAEGWKACLNDRDAQRSLWVTAEGFQAALVALEAALVTGTATWRKSGGQAGRPKKGR